MGGLVRTNLDTGGASIRVNFFFHFRVNQIPWLIQAHLSVVVAGLALANAGRINVAIYIMQTTMESLRTC